MAIWSARRYFENVLYYSVPVDHTGSLNNKQTRKDQHLAMGMHVSEGTALSCRKRRLINCFFGLIVVFTMLSMVVLTLFLFGVIPGDGCGMEDGCSRDVAEEVDAIDDILQVSTAAPVLSLNDQKMEHRPKKLTQSKLREFAALTDIDRFMGPEILDPLLRVRVPGTPGNAEVRQFIVSSLQSLQSWDIEEDQSTHWTPHNRANTDFVNVIATLRNPNAQPESDLKLVLACHYDSKHFPNDEFIGATDSAVPCAMLLDLAHNLKASLDAKTYMPYTLQLIFFDGEEAFVQWTSTDSLYGSRHLAQKWANMPHHSVSKQKVLDGIGLFVLLDLLGTSSPNFKNFFSTNTQSNRMYKHLQNIENRLAQNNELISYSEDGPYFSGSTSRGMIEDDHKPFLERGVDVVHVIATPFPSVWHRPTDNKSALNRNTIANLNKIFHVFVAEFLHLKPPQ